MLSKFNSWLKKHKKFLIGLSVIIFSAVSYFYKAQMDYNWLVPDKINSELNRELSFGVEKNLQSVEKSSLSDNIEEKKIIVHLSGEVNNPGVYELEEGARLIVLLKLAGKLKSTADLEKLNLASPLFDGEKVVIPAKNNKKLEPSFTEMIEKKNTDNISADSDMTEGEIININRAEEDELCSLNGIGPAKAESILKYRRENGFFTSKEELLNISGIGEKTLDNIREEISLK